MTSLNRPPRTISTGSAIDKALQVLLQTAATYEMLTKSKKGTKFSVQVATLHLLSRKIKASVAFLMTDDPPVTPPAPTAALSSSMSGIGASSWSDTVIGIILNIMADTMAFQNGPKGTKIEQKLTALKAFNRHFDVSVVVTLMDNP